MISRVNAPIRQGTLKFLRNAIMRGEFKPGDRLYEPKLCELIGVSRTSVREALRHLESEGLIKLIPQKGPVVATVTSKDAEDLYEVREILEGFACRLFADHATSAEISALLRILDLLDAYARERDVPNLVTESDNFYDVILEGCGNNVVYSLIKLLHARISFLRARSLSQQGRPFHSVRELRSIYEAIEKHDPDAAFEASCYHVRQAKIVALGTLRTLEKDNSSE
jgi:DNA-binding GntR family transcriptional regulator